ncbi:HlyD family secretion protein [Massilia sp. H-1]|nr:HlyD family secretion protein [Massilia sp. H-1]
MNPLFRQEALDAKGDSLLGGIRICRRIDFSLATITTLALAAGLLIFCTFAHVTRKAHAEGVLVPALGTLQVVSSGNGTIIEMHVREGQMVRQGDVVAVVGMDRSAGHGDTIELVLQNILNRTAALQEQRRGRIQLMKQRDRVLTSRIQSVSMQVRQVTEEMKLAQQRVVLAQKALSATNNWQVQDIRSRAQGACRASS